MLETREAYRKLFKRLVEKHQLALDELTSDQLAEAIRQALPDFKRNVRLVPVGLGNEIRQKIVYLPGSEADKWKTAYFELLYAVESVYEDESRHDTALRYIREAESRCSVDTGCCDPQST